MNTSATYGQRTCLFCGKPFEAGTLYQFFCSSECRLNRKRQRNREYEIRRNQRRVAELAALKKRVADLEEEIEFLKRTESHELAWTKEELASIREELAAAKEELEHTQLELARKQAELDAAREKAPAKGAEPVALKHLQKENTRLKSYVKELEERLQACGAMV